MRSANFDETTSGPRPSTSSSPPSPPDTATYASIRCGRWSTGPGRSSPSSPRPVLTSSRRTLTIHPAEDQRVRLTVFATDSSEFNALLANEINIGTIPPEDLPQYSSLESNYTLTTSPFWHIGFDNLNFKNPVTGPIVSQLYFDRCFSTWKMRPAKQTLTSTARRPGTPSTARYRPCRRHCSKPRYKKPTRTPSV